MVKRAAGGWLAVLLFSLFAPSAGFAQQPPVADAGATRQPAPPLFPRHRRGLYRTAAGIEMIDATPQSPPLASDDPGVPEPRAYEINFTTQADSAKDALRVDLLLVDANYGMRPVIAGYRLPSQIKIECPVAAVRDAGGSVNTGIGPATIGVKLNFYRDDRRGVAVAVYPQVEFAGSGSVKSALADAGQTIILPLLVAREFHAFTFVFNGALDTPVHDSGRHATLQFGGAFGRALTRKVAAMVEVRSESGLGFRNDRLVALNGGVIHGVRNMVVYGNVGHSLFSDDGVGHIYAGVGMKLLIDPPKKKDPRSQG